MPFLAKKRITSKPAIVLRGDILSTTGYAHVSRSIGMMLAQEYDVYFVSMHEDKSDNSIKPPAELIEDDDVRLLALNRATVVINHTTPNHFLPFADAANVGLFAWETPAIPRHLCWPEHMACMDAIWGPTHFVADFARSCDYQGPICVTPWPHDFDADCRTRAINGPDIEFDLLRFIGDAPDAEGWEASSIDTLRANGTDIFLAVQSLSPRKGLPILLSQWLEYVREQPNSKSILLLKLNFRHAHGIFGTPKEHFVELLRRFGFERGESARVGLISRSLSDTNMEVLIAKSNAFVSATYGEGFGLPVVEALRVETPVITSRHTGIADLLPSDYPLQFASTHLHIQLRDLIDVYPPSSSWFVAEPAALKMAFYRFAEMSDQQRSDAAQNGREHAAAFCSTIAARKAFAKAISDLIR